MASDLFVFNPNTMLRAKSIIAAFSVAALLFTACVSAPTTDTGTLEGDTITIGAIGPLTGDAASYGIPFQRAVEMAIQEVNADWAGQGRTLEVIWEDGACNGKDAGTAAQKLVDINKVEAIIGGFCSSETLAAAAVTEPAGVLLFSPASSSPDVTTAGDYVFRNWPSDAFQGTKFADLASDLGYETVGLISEQQDYTAGIARVFSEEFGGEVIEEKFLSEDTDMKTQLTKLKSEEVDVYFVNPQTDVKADLILKQMQELGIEGPFILNDVAGTNTEILANYSDLLEGAHTANVNIDMDDSDVLGFLSTYEENYGEEVTFVAYTVSAYDGLMILAQALEQVGNDGDSLKNYLGGFPGYRGLAGRVNFDENGDPEAGHSIFRIEDGKMVLQ